MFAIETVVINPSRRTGPFFMSSRMRHVLKLVNNSFVKATGGVHRLREHVREGEGGAEAAEGEAGHTLPEESHRTRRARGQSSLLSVKKIISD